MTTRHKTVSDINCTVNYLRKLSKELNSICTPWQLKYTYITAFPFHFPSDVTWSTGSVSLCAKDKGRELSGRCSGSRWMSVSDVISWVLSQSRAWDTAAPEWRLLRVNIGEVLSKQSCMDQDAFFNRQIYFAGCHLLVTLQKPPTGFYYIYLCVLMTSASFVISVNYVLLSVKCSLWPSGSGSDMLDFYVFWLKIHCTVTPPQTIWEAFLLHSECIPFLWISAVL